MISFAIIVFREVLEIALILGVLLTATRGLSDRNRWILSGIAAGIVGSVVIAIFAERISNALEGMGQEVFNATVLLLAAVLLAGTVVWMKRHAAVMVRELKEVSREVCEGVKPHYALAVVMALAVLRDGSEIVMLSFGTLASGQTPLSIIMGGILGLTVGTLVGVGICYGLIKFATKHIFNATSWMLILLAAGMVSQAIGFLSAAGYVPELVSPLWDTSKIMAEHSFVGTIFHTLIGYTDRPSAMQMICYISTIIVIALILKTYGNIVEISENIKKATVAIAITVLGIIAVFGFPTTAHATQHVYTPYVVKGELEMEARGNYAFDKRAEEDKLQKQKYSVGYGVTDRWFTEIEGELEKEYNDDGEDLDFDTTEIAWENKFQLTEAGQYPVDLGFLLEYAVSTEDKHADEVESRVILGKDIGKTSHYANFIFSHEVGGGHTNETEGGFAWSSRYRLDKRFEPGFEYHAEFGGLNEGKSFNEQVHQVGPVIYGQLVKNVKFDVGYLFGASDAAPQGTLKWLLEVEHYF
jgi:FTR1 family protein